VKEYQGKLSQSSDLLLEFLKLREKILFHFERVNVYANMKSHEDTAVGLYQNFVNQATSLAGEIKSALAFAEPGILAISRERLDQFIAENKELKDHEFTLREIIRRKPHTLSAELEEVLASAMEMAETPSNIFSIYPYVR